jgi:recombination protein RecA
MANTATVSCSLPARTDLKLKDAVQGLGSLPRGTITEIIGDRSTGRTALAQTMLVTATLGGEVAAWIDCDDTFDPASAARAGADLGKLLWVQCAHRLETAVKAVDMVLHSGGFGLVILDLCDVAAISLQKVPLSYWYRLRNAVQHTPSILLILARQSVAKSCSTHQLGMSQSTIEWRGLPPFQTMVRLESEAVTRKPYDAVSLNLDVFAEA